jgi:tRNA (guanine37-N1)-methyltransferase
MRFDVITLFPEMFGAITDEGVIARGIKKSLLSVNTWQLRNFSNNKHRNIDDAPYGGGGGMVMQVKPIRDCMRKIKQEKTKTKGIFLSPQREKIDKKLLPIDSFWARVVRII